MFRIVSGARTWSYESKFCMLRAHIGFCASAVHGLLSVCAHIQMFMCLVEAFSDQFVHMCLVEAFSDQFVDLSVYHGLGATVSVIFVACCTVCSYFFVLYYILYEQSTVLVLDPYVAFSDSTPTATNVWA